MKAVLIDARNFDSVAPLVCDQMRAAGVRGFDIETFDDAHERLKTFREKVDKVIFDVRRTTVAGFSLYAPNMSNSWYINLHHADAANRVPWWDAKRLLEGTSPLIIHNAPFERMMMRNSLGYELGDTICTLQMAVSNHGPDEYDPQRIGEIVNWDFRKLIPEVLREFRDYDPDISRTMTSRQEDVIAKVVGKEARSAWSYNGFADSISYHYDLKRLVKSFFGRQMTTFDQVINTPAAVARAAEAGVKSDMRWLTGEEVCEYGGDDAFEAVQLFYELIRRMSPELLQTFIETENPMTHVYADIWSEGIRINLDAVEDKFKIEAQNQIDVTARLKSIVQGALPFPDEPNAELMKREKWYGEKEKWKIHRAELAAWKPKKGKEFNANYYMKMRTILYDLFGLPIVFDQGKVASDAEARGKMLETATGAAREALLALKDLAGISQRLKLYLGPYQSLIDPATGHAYPTVSSKLATRRMAMENPNGMQLAKHNPESQYIRGFIQADE